MSNSLFLIFKYCDCLKKRRKRNLGKPGDQAEEEGKQLQVAAPWEPFVDTQERCAWY